MFEPNYFILTDRERDVFSLLANGKSTRDVAEALAIREKTVRNHITNVIQKLGEFGRKAAIEELIRLGEIE